MPRRLLFVLAPCLLASLAWAHIPVAVVDPVWATKGQPVWISHAFGHPHEAEWMPCERPDLVRVHAPSGTQHDVTSTLESFDDPKHRKWRAKYVPAEGGDHLIELHTRSKIGQTRFDDVIKTVVHAGGAPKGWGKTIGAKVEFVPLTRPYALPKGSSFRARLLVDGKPKADAIVGVEPMNDTPPKTKVPSELHMIRQEKTNSLGEFTVSLPKPGWYVLFANAPGEDVQEDGKTFKRKHRGSFWVRIGW